MGPGFLRLRCTRPPGRAKTRGLSAEPAHLDGLVAAIHRALGGADLRGALPLGAETAGAAPGSREAAELAMLHGVLADPIDARVVAHSLVHGVDHDHLVPLVHSVMRHPVGVEDTKAAALSPDPFL